MNASLIPNPDPFKVKEKSDETEIKRQSIQKEHEIAFKTLKNEMLALHILFFNTKVCSV